jgi:hypothetical protein
MLWQHERSMCIKAQTACQAKSRPPSFARCPLSSGASARSASTRHVTDGAALRLAGVGLLLAALTSRSRPVILLAVLLLRLAYGRCRRDLRGAAAFFRLALYS